MAAPPPSPPLLQVTGITKRFPGVVALSDVDMELGEGEVLAVIGENGAGKSTLMKILAGVEQPDAGRMLWRGRPIQLRSVQEAAAHRIALIHQELNLSGNLSVAANVFLGHEPRRAGFQRDRVIRHRAQHYLQAIGLDADPDQLAQSLPIGQQQMVEIAKALSMNSRVLIMDEPTSSLTQRETDALFEVIDSLRQSGVSIIYISHRLAEVRRIADRVVVLRDGCNAGQLQRDEITHEAMVHLMVGRTISQYFGRPEEQRFVAPEAAEALRVRGLRTQSFSQHPIDLAIWPGEIVGIAGLVGAGRTELLHALFGFEQPVAGTIEILGRPVDVRGPREAIRQGMALVPEDRKQQGVILEMAVRENLTLAALRRDRGPLGWLNGRAERQQTAQLIQQLRIKTPGQEQPVQYLSGGNQQKVVLGKWLALRPKVLLMDEPTRGIDVGAKQEIYQLMNQLAADGVSILFASSELEEIIGMSDRCLVMHQGQMARPMMRRELTEEAIMERATGKQPTLESEAV